VKNSFNIQELFAPQVLSKRHGTKPHASLPRQELSKDTKNTSWSILVWWDLTITEQNKLLSFIDRRWQGHNVTLTLFCFVCHAEISPQTRVLHEVVLISLKSSWWARGASTWSQTGFGATLWKLLIDYWTHFLNENKPLNRWFSHYNLGPKP
jgi:hypothetical protein